MHAPEPWKAIANGKLSLRRMPDFCFFLDPQRRCAVYDHRPQQCRAYPFLWTTYARADLDVDYSCPGLGRGETVPVKPRRPPAESKTKQIQRDSPIDEVRRLLRAQRRYAAPDVLPAFGERMFGNVADEELVIALPAAYFENAVDGLRELGITLPLPCMDMDMDVKPYFARAYPDDSEFQ